MSEDIPDLSERLEYLGYSCIAYIKTDDARCFVRDLCMHHREFCTSCNGDSPLAGTYAHTCSLLRPFFAVDRGFEQVEREWNNDFSLLKEIDTDIQDLEKDLTEERVMRWEEIVRKLKEGDVTFIDKQCLQGWKDFQINQDVQGMKNNWNFQDAWGNGPKIEEDLAPDEVRLTENLTATVGWDLTALWGLIKSYVPIYSARN